MPGPRLVPLPVDAPDAADAEAANTADDALPTDELCAIDDDDDEERISGRPDDDAPPMEIDELFSIE